MIRNFDLNGKYLFLNRLIASISASPTSLLTCNNRGDTVGTVYRKMRRTKFP